MRSKSGLSMTFILVIFFSGLLAAAGEENKKVPLKNSKDKIMFGVVFIPEANGRSFASQVRDMKELGVSCARFWLDWDWVEPKLSAFDRASEKFGKPPKEGASDLTLDYLTAHPELIEEYAFPEQEGSRFKGLIDWSIPDRLIKELNAAHISPLPLIADATAAPLFPGTDAPARISPEPIGSSCQTNVAGDIKTYRGIGREQYLAHIYLFSAGLARRYSQAPSKVVWWNTENELNWTYVHTTVAGWRCGKIWTDQKFLTELLSALHQGIKAGNPSALSTMNVNIHDPDWINDLNNWNSYMDALGIGSYPNYLFAWPLMDPLLTNAVKQAKARSNNKPVFVLETGYPSGPTQLGWNENLQARYVSRSTAGAVKQGAQAYIYFKLDDADLAIAPGNLQQVENHWGLIRVDGSRKPAFFAYKNAIANCGRD